MKQEWCPQHAGNLQNLSSMRYTYSIASPKPPGHTFATHEDLCSKTKPVFRSGDWYQLPSGGSRDHDIEKWLSVADAAKLVVETTNGGLKSCTVKKGAIVLAERLNEGLWMISVPYSGEPIDDAEDTESIAGDGALDPTSPASAADAA
jgi:hypothetical protein